MLQMMELPLPYDKLNNDISEFNEENFIQKNTNLSMTLSTFFILIYRYCMNVYFPLVIYEQEKLKIYSIPSSTSKVSEIIRIVDMILQNKIECEKEENYNSNIIFVYNQTNDDYKFLNKNAKIIISFINDYENYIKIKIIYDKKSFNKNTIINFYKNYTFLFEQLKMDDNKDIKQYGIVSKDELMKIKKFDYRDIKPDININNTFIDYFIKQVNERKNSIAVIEGEKEWTYREIHELSNYYANVIKQYDNKFIAIYSHKDIVTIIAILAILKAGKCIVTINPTYPHKRVEYICDSMNIDIVFICKNNINLTDKFKRNIILVDESVLSTKNVINKDKFEIFNCIKDNIDSPCYIIFTSGTTGEPKGIQISHRSIMIELEWLKKYFKYDSEIKSLHILNYSFDFGLYDIFINLYCGGCLCSIDKNKMKNFTEYVNFILKHKINNINTTPSFFNILASFNTKLKDIKYVHLGGEKVTYPMISRYNRILSTNCNIYNGYGPCECTVGCLIYKLSKKEREGVYRSLNSVPIGKPTDDSHILILDEENNQVPIGSIGEIYVSGNSLGIGYVKNEDNIGRFIELDTYENKRFYKTGDLARWLEDGNIEFIGRKDSQIKVNGFRIELSEIDTILLKFDEIIDAKTISIQLNQQNSIISIIYTSDNISVQEIKRRLADYLPYYMIPSRIIVGEIPYLSSGKVDIVKIKEKYIMGEL